MSKRKRENNSQYSENKYCDGYDDKKRWMSYWHQIKNVRDLNPETVLEVGPGSKTVSTYLDNHNFDVTTVDINPELEPDYTCDVRELSESFEENSFDLILCAEVLEHLPFEDFQKALAEIHRVTKKYVVLSLPHSALNLKISAGIIPFLQEKHLLIKIPITRLTEQRAEGAHYWSIGKKKYPLKRIKEKINDFFEIKKTYCPYSQPYHRFFKLEAK